MAAKIASRQRLPPPASLKSDITVSSIEYQRAQRHMMYGPVIGAHVYAQQMKPVASNQELQDGALGHAVDIFRRLDCRDPLEEMLAMQAMWTHARVARLSAMANQQTGRDNLQVVNEACDKASNTFRKLMVALAEYRRPPKPADVRVTAVGQTNVAAQQVVQQTVMPPGKNETAANELGSGRDAAKHSG